MTTPPNSARRTTLNDEELRELSRMATLREVDAGEVIFEIFDEGDRMYLVETGAVDLRFENGVPAKQVGAMGFFGELALLFGSHRRSATAIAAEPSRLWELDLKNFDALSDESPRLLFSVLRRSCASLLESERSLARYLKRRNHELATALEQLQVTEQQLTDAEVAAHTDSLTGLYNRRYLKLEIATYLDRAARGEIGLVLVVMDLDDFKQINDEHGHVVGDEALCGLADRLRDNLRRSDLACRIGGDEFAVFMAHVPESDPSLRVASLFRRITPFEIQGDSGPIRITVSLGGTAALPGETWSAFYERADENLYLAKEAGRNRLSWNGQLFEL